MFVIAELLLVILVIVVCIMSDGVHNVWEKRPRFTSNTMSNSQKFSNGILRRIERAGPDDDFSLVSIMVRVTSD